MAGAALAQDAEKDWGVAKVDELSRGMQQKVQFIATLLHDPDLVILDEPFSGLDPINAQALKDAVARAQAARQDGLFSTHLMDNAERMCDSVCIIARGEKVLDGSVAGVKAEHGRAQHRAGGHRRATCNGSAAVLRDTSLVKRVDDPNRLLRDRAGAWRRSAGAAAPCRRFRCVRSSASS